MIGLAKLGFEALAALLGVKPSALGRALGVIAAAAIAALLLLAAKRAYEGQLRAEGEAACRERIIQRNKEAADVAAQTRTRVRACYDGGGVWNALEGSCQR